MSNNNSDFLVSEAARPGLWLKERFTPSAWLRMLSEKMVPEYEERMEAIREFDDQLEEKLENIDEYLNRLMQIRKTKGALRAAKLAEVAILLNEINSKLRFPSAMRQKLLGNLGAMTEDDLLEFESAIDVDPSFLEAHHKDFHEEIRGRKEKKSEAGFFGDLIRSLVSWKLQTPEMVKRDKALRKVIDKANVAVKKFKAERDKMAAARAKGDIAGYLQALDKIEKIHSSFQDGSDGQGGYRAIYEKYLFAPMEKALQIKREKGEEGPEVLDESAVVEGAEAEAEAGLEEPKKDDSSEEGVSEDEGESTEDIVDEELKKDEGPKDDTSYEGKEAVFDEERPPMPTTPKQQAEEGGESDATVLTPDDEDYNEYERRLLPGKRQPQQLDGGPYPELGPPRGDKTIYPKQEPSSQRAEPVITPEPQYPQLPTGETQPQSPAGWEPTQEWVAEAPTEEAQKERYQYWLNYVMPTQKREPYTGASLQNIMQKMSHSRFMDELNKVGKTNNTGLMVAMIAKYSEQIEKDDPEMSAKLLGVAQDILNG